MQLSAAVLPGNLKVLLRSKALNPIPPHCGTPDAKQTFGNSFCHAPSNYSVLKQSPRPAKTQLLQPRSFQTSGTRQRHCSTRLFPCHRPSEVVRKHGLCRNESPVVQVSDVPPAQAIPLGLAEKASVWTGVWNRNQARVSGLSLEVGLRIQGFGAHTRTIQARRI